MELKEFLELVKETNSFTQANHIMRHQNKKKKRDNLESKVKPQFKPLKDYKGRYVPYCDFGYHQGLVKTPEVCESRKCKYYHKLYI